MIRPDRLVPVEMGRSALPRALQRRLAQRWRRTAAVVRAHPRHALAVTLVTVVGVALRLYGLGTESLWVDEAITAALLRRFGTLELVTAIPREQPHLPTYYVLLDLWAGVVGRGDAALRTFSAVFGVAALPFVYGLGRRLFDRRVGLLALAVTACSRFQLYYAQEVRMYAMLTALTVASYYCLLRREELRWAAGYVVTAVGAAYVHPFGGLGVLGGLAYLALAARLDSRGLDTDGWPGVAGDRRAPAVVALSLVPLVVAAAREFAKGVPLSYLSRPGLDEVARSLLAFFGAWPTPGVGVAVGGLLALLGVAALVPAAAAATGRRRVTRGTGSTLLLACWAAVPVVVLVAVSYLITPVFWYRYALPAAPACYLLVARGGVGLADRVAAWLDARRATSTGSPAAADGGGRGRDGRRDRLALALRVALAALLVLALVPSVAAYHTTDGKDQWEEAVGTVESRADPGDLVLVDGCLTMVAYDRYRDREDLAVRGVIDVQSAMGVSPTPPDVIRRAVHNRSTVWTVLAHISDREERRLRGIVRETHRPARNRSYVSIEVTRYERRTAAERTAANGSIPSRSAFDCRNHLL
ncbi:glycosyltransferase family 39 protein [Haloglomus halophilum]|uniref:glycosyltransferase family 39 protein n=1 Tax=Haloglomus halophilum TaxID=2962672 RepID=UPI0020CA17F9|nr:glycosyltransferase family 39 protein [Haloglomus halophilum]